jgi:hypothetical protein
LAIIFSGLCLFRDIESTLVGLHEPYPRADQHKGGSVVLVKLVMATMMVVETQIDNPGGDALTTLSP